MGAVLPSDLLVARARGPYVLPMYSRMSDRDLYVAGRLIEAFRSHVGRRRGELDERLRELEDEAFRLGCDYRFARGLIHLLYRRAEFSRPRTKVDPLRARLEVFAEASRALGGFALTEGERERVLRAVAERLGVSVGELVEAFDAAYEEEQLLTSFGDVSPEELLRAYNLSLTQTLLFKALEVVADVRISGTAAKVLLFNVKRLGLMYTAERLAGGVRIRIDGPASVVKQTERYGTRMAELVPYVMAADEWRISARVRRRGRLYRFSVSSRLSHLFPKVELRWAEYDSSVEEQFYRRFQTLGSGWRIEREPEPLVAGRHILVPDFAFTKGGVKVYLEIVGFWTEDYLRRKLEKLRSLRSVNMILAVDERLACSSFRELGLGDVIYFRGRLPAPEVYLALKKYEPRAPARAAAARRAEEPPPEVPPEVEEYLSRVKVAKLSTIVRELSKYGLTPEQVVRVLERRGFRLDWRGLGLEDVTVRR